MVSSKQSIAFKRSVKKRKSLKVSTDGLLYPLDLVYKRAGVDLPHVRTIAPHKIPLPYRSLLVHKDDMTLTLERYFGGRIVLRTFSTLTINGWYFRRVLLVQESSGHPVEMGAIRIKLSAFTPQARKKILANKIPLGRILHSSKMNWKILPKSFLSISPNGEMMGAFWMRKAHTLFGRRTEMFKEKSKIGDIVEVLPPVQ